MIEKNTSPDRASARKPADSTSPGKHFGGEGHSRRAVLRLAVGGGVATILPPATLLPTAALLPVAGLFPTAAQAAVDLEVALKPRVIGAPDAPLHMAEYFSLSCSHCANFHKGTYQQIKKDWIDTGKLRFEFRDFPLQGPAIYAHALARAVPEQAYEGMLDILLDRQRQWAGANDPISELAKIARIAGIGRDRFIEIIENRPLLEGVVAIAQRGYSTWGIQSTPSFVINDDDIIRGNVGYEEFLSAFNAAAA